MSDFVLYTIIIVAYIVGAFLTTILFLLEMLKHEGKIYLSDVFIAIIIGFCSSWFGVLVLFYEKSEDIVLYSREKRKG